MQLRTLFDCWDKAGDGHINFVELCQGLSKMRQPLKHKKVFVCSSCPFVCASPDVARHAMCAVPRARSY